MSSLQRQKRIRKKIHLGSDKLRLSVFRSNKYMYAQVIDSKGNALFGLAENSITKKGSKRMDNARLLGQAIAKIAIEKKIKEIVFDKGRFAYHGKVKALAEGAREGGLQF